VNIILKDKKYREAKKYFDGLRTYIFSQFTIRLILQKHLLMIYTSDSPSKIKHVRLLTGVKYAR